MESVVLVIHLILALAIIILVLLQRSEGGGLGIGGGGGGLGGFASAKGTANALTKMTTICAAGFFITSLTLGVLASQKSKENIGLLKNMDVVTQIKTAPPIDKEIKNVDKKLIVNKESIANKMNNETNNISISDGDGDNNKTNTKLLENKPKEEPSAPVE